MEKCVQLSLPYGSKYSIYHYITVNVLSSAYRLPASSNHYQVQKETVSV